MIRVKFDERIDMDKAHNKLLEKEKDISKKYKRALRELSQLESEKNALLELRRGQRVNIIKSSRSEKISESTVVVCASDWHVEEEVKKTKVSWLNEYNLDIATDRANHFFRKAVSLTRKEQQDVVIKEMVLFLGGDLISGNINEDVSENCLLRPIDAALFAQELLVSGINYLINNSELRVTVICSCGNHSRITGKTRVANEQGNSLEYFMYHTLRSRLQSERVRFIIGDGYHTYFQIYDKTFRFHHGHNLRYQGGVGGITIPVNKAIAQWNKAKRVDYDVFGHWHVYMPLANFISNGSMIGYNPYAVSIKADFERPQQAMFLVDKARGVTYHFPILF